MRFLLQPGVLLVAASLAACTSSSGPRGMMARPAADRPGDATCYETASGTGAVSQTLGPAVDLRAIARIVAENAGLRPGEMVLIRGGADDLAFMEQLVVAIAAQGGQPLLHVSSDAVLRQWYHDVPERFDDQRDEWGWTLLQKADVILEVGRPDPDLWNEIPAARLDS
jgi:hypothetical protein